MTDLPMTPEEQVRSIQTDTTAYGATDITAMENRVLAMEMLYKFAGRDNPDSTMNGLYTALWAPYPTQAP
jgi:hypothetical protein